MRETKIVVTSAVEKTTLTLQQFYPRTEPTFGLRADIYREQSSRTEREWAAEHHVVVQPDASEGATSDPSVLVSLANDPYTMARGILAEMLLFAVTFVPDGTDVTVQSTEKVFVKDEQEQGA